MSDLDPRWEWVEIGTLGAREPTYVKGRCNHLDVVPVNSGDVLAVLLDKPETVAFLCLTCDAQLPAEWMAR